VSWPIVEREPVRLPTLAGHDAGLWDTLIELCEVRPGEWTLVGGQMVFLHGLEHGVTAPRVSTDLDILVNARVMSGAVAKFAAAVEAHGFVLDGISPDEIAHRYRRGDVSIDILAPDGLGARTDLTTTPPGRTVQVPGGTQALDRTELLPVSTTEPTGSVPRPSLLGAVVAKAVAVGVDDLPNAQRLDLAFLLTLIDDPFALAGELTSTDRRRIRARHELVDDEHPVWTQLPQADADRGRAGLRVLMS
jgi:hypothetical protein